MRQLHLKLLLRSLLKNGSFSAINIVGLSVSLAVCLLLGTYLHFEHSFDRSNPDYKRIYRLNTTFKYPNSPESTHALSSAMMGPYLLRECGGIEQYLRVVESGENLLFRSGNREITIEKCLEADSSFFEFFNFPLCFGDTQTAWSKPGGIILTRPMSAALFGSELPLGKTIENTFTLPSGKDTTISYEVSGVLDDLPHNSHLRFDALLPLDARQFDQWAVDARWHSVVASTYFRLTPSAQPTAALESVFAEVLKKEMPNSEMIALHLQSLAAVHLGSTRLLDEQNYLKSNQKQLDILALIAAFILFISGVNFANLSTVQALRRGQEVGIRKSLGASRGHVFRHFLGESFLFSILASGIGLLWACLLRKPFFEMIGRDFDLSFPPTVLLAFAGIVVVLGFLSGIYPALEAARQGVARVFRQHATAVSMKRPFVQQLVVAQFVLSGILIIGSFVAYLQLNFMKNKDLGFQYAQVVEINIGESNWMHAKALKSELAAIPGVVAVSSSDRTLGTIDDQNGVLVRNAETRQWENHPMSIVMADFNYFDLYGIKFSAGRPPTQVGAANGLEYVVNETFVKKMGWRDDPIGKEIVRATFDNPPPGHIVGVIRDVHHNTLRHAIEPVCFQASEVSSVISMKIEPRAMQEVLARAQAVWGHHVKDRPFDYVFMDEQFAQLYDSENRLAKALFLGTILAIVIACLGLLALSAFAVRQRTKEIGIRKVLGASVAGITGLLAKDFLKLVLVAIVIASPIAYYFMQRWLADFAYRIDIQWWMFALAGATAVLIAFLTVGFQSVKAALANPVKSLRSE